VLQHGLRRPRLPESGPPQPLRSCPWRGHVGRASVAAIATFQPQLVQDGIERRVRGEADLRGQPRDVGQAPAGSEHPERLAEPLCAVGHQLDRERGHDQIELAGLEREILGVGHHRAEAPLLARTE
jgi:hypothetical protein